jgi:Prp8 binding protein
VYTAKFSPDGERFASGSHDKSILLWNTYGNNENWGVLNGHTGAVLDLAWQRDGSRIYSASADKTGAVWDVEMCTRVKKLRDHKSYVNSVSAARQGDPLLVTGSDDCFALVWDTRVRGPVHRLESDFAVTCVAMSDNSQGVFSGGIDEKIQAWDLRTGSVLYSLNGHSDTVTGLSLSPDGTKILSNSMDNTLRMWDVRPYVGQQRSRFLGHFTGAQHDFQKNLLKAAWSPDGTRVTCGSSDNFVHVWEAETKRMLYKLPGHKAAVNEVVFHPKEPIILSASSDKTMFMGEIEATL